MMDRQMPTQQIKRVANRAKREALFRIGPVRSLAEQQDARRRRRHSSRLPTPPDSDRELVTRICDTGVEVTTLDALALPGTAPMQERLSQLVTELASRPASSSTLRPTRDELLADLCIWNFGLGERLLDLVESYLEVPVRYYGADVRREVADGKVLDVRRWHRDTEDYRVLKLLIWLNDVDSDGGPFAYIPRIGSARIVDRLHYVGGFISDDKIQATANPADRVLATGPKWTVVLPDTAAVLHRATPPVARDRYSVTFTWTSRTPLRTNPVAPFNPDQVRRMREGLNMRQIGCLPCTLV
jgi:hypothetical protein